MSVELLLVALGGMVGGLARVAVSTAAAQLLGDRLPWGTFAVNLSGAFAIGLLAAPLAGHSTLWLLLVTGLLGSYTTVSTFSLQTLYLAEQRAWGRAALNVLGTTGLCVLAAAAGFALAQR